MKYKYLGDNISTSIDYHTLGLQYLCTFIGHKLQTTV